MPAKEAKEANQADPRGGAAAFAVKVVRTLKYLKGTYLDPLPGGLKEAESLHHEARRTKPNKTRKSQHSPIMGKIPIHSRSGQLLGRPRSNAMRLSPNFPRRGFGRGLRANGKAWRHVFWDSNLFLERRGDAPPWRHTLWPFALEPTNARTTSPFPYPFAATPTAPPPVLSLSHHHTCTRATRAAKSPRF